MEFKHRAAWKPFRHFSRSESFGRLLCKVQAALPLPACYAAAILAATIGFGLRFAFIGAGDARFPFMLGYPVVILCAGLFGFGPAIAAAVTTIILPAWFLLPPLGSFSIADPVMQTQAMVFATVSVLLGYTIQALTDAKASSEAHSIERRRLLFELKHRVNNDNMALLSMADLMARGSNLPEVRSALLAFRARIRSIGLVHDLLSEAMEDPEEPVDSGLFIEGLIGRLHDAAGRPAVVWRTEIEPHELPRVFIGPIGFILNELAINALKHAFPEGREGCVTVRFWREVQRPEYVLQIEDDGVGHDPSEIGDPLRAYIRPRRGEAEAMGGFGNRFIAAYASNLGGRFEGCEIGAQGGSRCTVRFPTTGRHK